MFKKKDKKEKKTSNSTSSSYNNTTQVQSNNGGRSSITITRQTSTQSSHTRNTEERIFSTFHHSSSTGNVPRILEPLQTDATPFTLRTGSNRNLPLLSSRLQPGNLSTNFGTSSNSTNTFATTLNPALTPRLSLQHGPSGSAAASTSTSNSPRQQRTAFGPNTFGSYPSRSRPSPLTVINGQSAAQNTNLSQSMIGRTEDIIPTYPNICSKRGKALVINNIKFHNKGDERLGAEKDSKDLERFLKSIGFEVKYKKDLKGKEMLKEVETFSKSNFSIYDMSLVVIMSHGNNLVQSGDKLVRVRGGYTEIAGIDNVGMLTDDVIEKFTGSYGHPSLKGKPKIFIFQCCRGERDQEVCHDAAPIKKVLKEHSDMLIAYSTLPGYLLNRDPKTGSWYIQSICEVFERHYKDQHIEDMLKVVNRNLSSKHPTYTQTSTYENRGFNICYLYPRRTQ